MERQDLDVDAWLDAQDDPTLSTLDRELRAGLPGRGRALWTGVFWGGTEQSILGYGDIVQPRPRGADVAWFAVGLARQKRHHSLYVNVADGDRYLGQVYADRLGRVRAGAASLSFTDVDDLDLGVLREMLAHVHRLVPPEPGPAAG
jgi:hypothetical protein